MKLFYTILFLSLFTFTSSTAQQSVARQWNEALLDAIRVDVSRPTVHARNLFHLSAAMYDAWAAYDDIANTCMLNRQVGDYYFAYDGIELPADPQELQAAREKAISYAAYRLLKHRFTNSPGAAQSLPAFDALMLQLGYDTAFISTDYTGGDPAALGNYIALSCMEFGMLDHSDEEQNYDYDDDFYQPLNPPLIPTEPGNPDIVELNHWQPLAINPESPRRFLNPQWGYVTPFSLTEEDLTIYDHNGNAYYVFYDPGAAPEIDTSGAKQELEDYYKWNFTLVAVWSGHLDPDIPVMVDISPASIGNISALPTNEAEMREFYHFLEGGVNDNGYDLNPVTGDPYESQIVPMGDFARVLAEFWADGPNSETPPGHWFTILNYVNDHPLFEKRFGGEGEILDDLEWDVKAYLVMGGAMHDVAVAVWGIKSHYDFIRPISAIRAMADLGQCSDTNQLSFHPGGLPLIEGHIEVVEGGDALEGEEGENIGKIKLYAWKGPDHISDPASENAGVGWILAENWWPYQQPNFITPPFAGYVSGHSTFSRAAAEVMTLLTGDEYFPGGMGIFDAPKDEYLIFENGPGVDIQLQWAKYRDASDQASLSRLWGGIHPPVDDVPGRWIGKKIGPEAFNFAAEIFAGAASSVEPGKHVEPAITLMQNFPNPARWFTVFEYSVKALSNIRIDIYDINGMLVERLEEGTKAPGVYQREWDLDGQSLSPGIYAYQLVAGDHMSKPSKLIIME